MAKSAGKDKEKSLSEKLKSFLGFKETTPLNFDHLKFEPYQISAEVIKDIFPDKPLPHRLKTLKELGEIVMSKRLDDNIVETLYKKTEDIVNSESSTEARHTVLQFYSCVLAGQLEKMTIMRSVFFRLIFNHRKPEDASVRLELLKTLSDNGKTITYFEDGIGPLLLNWCPEMLLAGKATEFLPLVVNIIKHNAAYLDDEIVTGYIKCVCTHCGKTSAEDDIELCLDVMDAVLCYSHLPSNVLQHFVFALCLTVNVQKFSQVSWKLMRNLLGTSLGHSTVYSLLLFLQDRKKQLMPAVLRGSVFFIGMAFWGSKKVETLSHSPSTVLPSFRMALSYGHNIVAFEVALSVQRLVKKNGENLPIYVWELLLDIVEMLLKYPELQHQNAFMNSLATCVHDLITAIEDCRMPYCNERLYKIIERCSHQRDEKSVIRLITHHARNIHPIRGDCISNITHLLDKYFKNEKRQNVQLKVVQVLRNLRIASRHTLEDDAIDQVLLRFMCHLEKVPDETVRKAVVDFLLEITETCISKRYFDILDIIEKVLKCHFDAPHHSEVVNPGAKRKSSCIDVEAAIQGLINIFEKKLHTPSSHCVKAYNMLINHILLQYNHLCYTESNVKIRRLIIDFLLRIRTNFKKQVGILVADHAEFSFYVLCNTRDPSTLVPASPAPGTASVFNFFPLTLSFEEMFQVLLSALKQEKDWIILELLFRNLPKFLQNKALVLSGNCNINTLCITLCTLVNDKSLGYPENLHNAPSRLTHTEFQSQVFPVIASLAAYRCHMESRIQSMLIRCLQSGLVSRSAKVCIEGLTLCTLEMRNMMVKQMSAVLLKLSHISATVSVAVAVLGFLSNLIRLPQLYVSFVEDQYRSIFAIALPYTNPFKFNQYTVALAHHVIAMWFLKCRTPFRKEFAKYITNGLKNNLCIPFVEDHGNSKDGSNKNNSNCSNEKVISLHTELLEIGMDLMARFTFGMSSNAPKRTRTADFILEKGEKSSWVIGNKIVTITTSGCGTKSFKYGLCERCYVSCREACDSMGSDDSESAAPATPEPIEESQPNGRRRHRSAFNRRNITMSEKLESTSSTKDDIRLHRQRSRVSHLFRRNTTSATATVPESVPDIIDDDSTTDEDKKSNAYQLCACWCSGWAEVYFRHPTGNSSFLIQIQNQLLLPTSTSNVPLDAISSLLLPHIPGKDEGSQHESDTQCPYDNEEEELSNAELLTESCEETVSSATSDALMCPKLKVPLRRTNSSPDMNSGFLSYNRYCASRRQALNSDITVEEPTPFDNGSNGDIFPEEQPRRKCDNVTKAGSNRSKVKVGTHFDLTMPKNMPTNLPRDSQPPIGNDEDQLPNAFRDRGHTISVMSPSRTGTSGYVPHSKKNKDMHRSGMNPSFVFLQLFHNSFPGSTSEKPLFLRQTEQNARSLMVLDHIHPYDTHKIGVVYVGLGQVDEQVILSNMYGSARYVQFLRGLGNLVRLSDVNQELTYVGGLDLKGNDGKFALVWHDDVMRVAFHVATLMPNRKDDIKRNNKKAHVGNNFVTIVYNESNREYNIATIKSHFTRACVIIHPEDFNSNVVTIKVKNTDMREVFGHTDAYIVSDESLPIFVRQMAMHANLASLILDPRQESAHVSNWLARLHAIKRLRKKVLDEMKLSGDRSRPDNRSNYVIDDFTDYV